MKKNCLLPMAQPDFICQNYISCANAVVKANAGRDADVLLLSKYINCSFDKNDGKHRFVISVFDHWCAEQRFMRFQLIDLLKEPYQKRKQDVAATIKKCLLQGCYILTQCNRTYFEETDDPDSMLFFCLLVGFDDETQTFTLYGMDLLNRFSRCQVTYQKFLDALFDTEESNIPFQLWSRNKNATVSLDLPNLIFELEDYIHATSRRKNASAELFYGLAAMQELVQYFYKTAETDFAINEAYLRKYWIHKAYMKQRMEYLAQNGMIDRAWMLSAESVFKMATEALECGKAFNRLHDRGLIKTLVKNMHAALALEETYLPKLLEELKKLH